MVSINIQNLTQSKIDQEFLKDTTKKILKELGFKKSVEVAIVLAGEGRIKALNKKYRGKNRVTDVLAFGAQEETKNIVKLKKEGGELGDIVICIPRAKKQAKRQGHSFEKELTILLIHGLLHLGGYNHEQPKEAEAMQSSEAKILGELEV